MTCSISISIHTHKYYPILWVVQGAKIILHCQKRKIPSSTVQANEMCLLMLQLDAFALYSEDITIVMIRDYIEFSAILRLQKNFLEGRIIDYRRRRRINETAPVRIGIEILRYSKSFQSHLNPP
jgi:hypothetical protein